MPYNTEQALLSSPDPLNDSPTYSSPVKALTPKARTSFPLQGSSPRKQTFQLDVGDKLSPHKIKVTVEAEHSEENVNIRRRHSGPGNVPSSTSNRVPAVRQSVRTTTTTIPVKGLSDSEDDSSDSASEKPTRGRGRPRKSFGTPIPVKSRNRAGTPRAKPSPSRRRTLGYLVDGDDPEDWDFAIGAGVEVSRGKGRSRSRSVKGGSRNKSTPAAKQISSPEKMVSSTTSRKGRGRRKTLTPEEIMIHEDDIDVTPNFGIRNNDERFDTQKVLAQRDINLVPTHSAHIINDLTNTNTNGNDNPELLRNKFSPAKRTTSKAGLSSSRNGLATIRSSALSVTDVPQGITKLPADSLQSATFSESTKIDLDDNYQNNEDRQDEVREFDTILESEGFSMISVDSVPSLRKHLSSPLGPNHSGQEGQSTAADRDIYLQEKGNGIRHEDSFSSIAPEVLEAATPMRKASNPLFRAVLSANITGDGDSFSSIPPEILEAATPGKQNSNNKFLSVKLQKFKSNDDSFSSMSPAIFEVATPAKHIQIATSLLNAQSTPKDESKFPTKLTILSSLPLSDTRKPSLASSGLLTPNETPSPIEVALKQDAQVDHCETNALSEPETSHFSSAEESLIVNSQMKSSPPSAIAHRFAYTANSCESEPPEANFVRTPSVVFSSPTLPPLVQQLPPHGSQKVSELEPKRAQGQSLSPIVRAGRVLQDVAMKPTSRIRTESLGSPFKSPTAQHNSSGDPIGYFGTGSARIRSQKSSWKDKGSDDDLFVGFSDDTRQELRKSMIMGEEFARNEKPSTLTNTVNLTQEDPFRIGVRSEHSSSLEKGKEYTLELPSQKLEISLVRGKEYQQYQNSPGNESAMSWQAESTVPICTISIVADKSANSEIAETELFEKSRQAEWARERMAVSSQIESASPSKVIIIDSDGEVEPGNLNGELDEDEEDIWQAEARLSSSLLESQPPKVQQAQGTLEKPRRSKIPSPWRKNNKGLVNSDELPQRSMPQQLKTIGSLPSSIRLKPKSKLDQVTVRKCEVIHDPTEEDEDPTESSIMWHIPQKSNFAPQPRNRGNLDLSALLASSPLKMPRAALKMRSASDVQLGDTAGGEILGIADVELEVPSSPTTAEVSVQEREKEYESVDNSLEHGSSVEFTQPSYEEFELAAEPSCTESEVCYPDLLNTTAASPQKSCLRTPTSTSPSKSVAFVSPTPSPPPLSNTTWSKAHWKLLHAMYDDSKLERSSSSSGWKDINKSPDVNGESSLEPSKYLGKTIQARGIKLTLEQWHLDIVRVFREEVPGWDEGIVAKRLFAIFAGEDLRRQGKE